MRFASILVLLLGLFVNSSAVVAESREEQVLKLLDKIARQVDRQIYRMDERKISELMEALYAVEAVLETRRPDRGDQCSLLGSGTHNFVSYQYRVFQGENFLSGHSSLDSALASIEKFREGGVCSMPRRTNNTCTVGGRVTINFAQYKYSMFINGNVLNGLSSFQTLIENMAKLSNAQVCRLEPSGKCELLGAGTENFISYRFRVEIDGKFFEGFSRQDDAFARIRDMRTNNICY